MKNWFIKKLKQPLNGHYKYVIEDGHSEEYVFGYYDTKEEAEESLKEALKNY